MTEPGDAKLVAIGGPHDAAGIAAVHLATRRSAYRHIVATEVLAQMTAASVQRWWEERLSSAPQPHRLLVARAQERRRSTLGFAHVGPGEGAAGEVYAIHVDPRFQGIGLGGHLLAAALAALREFGFRCIRLWVLAENHNARNFYEYQGWRLVEGACRTDTLESAVVTEVAYARDLGSTTATRR